MRRRRDFCVTSGRIAPLSRSSGNAARRRRDLCVTSGRRQRTVPCDYNSQWPSRLAGGRVRPAVNLAGRRRSRDSWMRPRFALGCYCSQSANQPHTSPVQSEFQGQEFTFLKRPRDADELQGFGARLRANFGSDFVFESQLHHLLVCEPSQIS